MLHKKKLKKIASEQSLFEPQIKEANAKKRYLMGNKDLTKLWNLCPDNLEAASAPERDFLPSMDEYLSEAVEQLDPAQQVNNAVKL